MVSSAYSNNQATTNFTTRNLSGGDIESNNANANVNVTGIMIGSSQIEKSRESEYGILRANKENLE